MRVNRSKEIRENLKEGRKLVVVNVMMVLFVSYTNILYHWVSSQRSHFFFLLLKMMNVAHTILNCIFMHLFNTVFVKYKKGSLVCLMLYPFYSTVELEPHWNCSFIQKSPYKCSKQILNMGEGKWAQKYDQVRDLRQKNKTKRQQRLADI